MIEIEIGLKSIEIKAWYDDRHYDVHELNLWEYHKLGPKIVITGSRGYRYESGFVEIDLLNDSDLCVLKLWEGNFVVVAGVATIIKNEKEETRDPNVDEWGNGC